MRLISSSASAGRAEILKFSLAWAAVLGVVGKAVPRSYGLCYFEQPRKEVLQHGETRFWNAHVPGRLRRPPEVCTKSRGLSSFRRASAWPDRHDLRSRHIRGSALLGRRSSGLGRGRSRVRGGLAEATEVGRVALTEFGRPQRHAHRG